MQVEVPRANLRKQYDKAAQEYLRALPLEHFMESTPQATQRKITVESFDVVQAYRADVHVFSELLVQYPLPERKKPGQVVPDNMVVIHTGPIDAVGSYDLPLQPARPFWMLEYFSKSSRRKDYQDNMRKYERELKVPYYLLFEPEKQTMSLFHRARGRYAPVKPNAAGRCEVAELEIEVALADIWVRFWYQGKLLRLPADLLHDLEKTEGQLAESNRRNEELEREIAILRAREKNGKK
jgi:hypothetical protein